MGSAVGEECRHEQLFFKALPNLFSFLLFAGQKCIGSGEGIFGKKGGLGKSIYFALDGRTDQVGKSAMIYIFGTLLTVF